MPAEQEVKKNQNAQVANVQSQANTNKKEGTICFVRTPEHAKPRVYNKLKIFYH